MLPKEQIAESKKQILKQINSTFPEEKKAPAIQQIESMNDEQFIEFLKQNNLLNKNEPEQQCIFCSIVSEKIRSYKIGENKDAIAILEINPISKAHSLIIPKQHISEKEKLPKNVLKLAKEIEKKIKIKYKPKKILLEYSNLFGHQTINLLPVYKNETLNSKRHKAEEKELLELQKELQTKQKPEIIKKPKPEKINSKSLFFFPKRIP